MVPEIAYHVYPSCNGLTEMSGETSVVYRQRATDLEQSTLRIGATHEPVRDQHQQEPDSGLECTRCRSHANISQSGKRTIDIGINHIRCGVEFWHIARHLVEETKVCIENFADRKEHVENNQWLKQGQRDVPDPLPGCSPVKVSGFIVFRV